MIVENDCQLADLSANYDTNDGQLLEKRTDDPISSFNLLYFLLTWDLAMGHQSEREITIVSEIGAK